MVTIPGPSSSLEVPRGTSHFGIIKRKTTRRARISRAFSISTKEVTIEQFRRYDPNLGYAVDYTPSMQCPANMISWLDAVRYCRWLSEQEGIPEDQMCYPEIESINSRMVLDPDYLDRTGYRLPTGAEWEYACRAGASTTRYYGYSPDLLSRYAWEINNSGSKLQPVGQLLPNDFGLFDTLGNVMEWTQDPLEFTSGFTSQVHVDEGEAFGNYDFAVRDGSRKRVFVPALELAVREY